MKKIMMFILVISVLAISPLVASAGTIEGSVQGFQCVTQGITCPVGQEDPMAAAEDVFVVLSSDVNGKFYFVPNVNRTVLARHINERIKVTGNVSKKYDSIKAKKIEIFKNGVWVLVWTQKLQEDVYDTLGTSGRGKYQK